MGTPNRLATKVIKPFAGVLNRARLGFPRSVFQGVGGLGDDLMATMILHELKKRGVRNLVMSTHHPGLFQNNSDVDRILFHPRPRLNRWLKWGLPLTTLSYATYDPARDADQMPNEHILIKLSRLACISGLVELRPYLFLTHEELAAGRLVENQVVIQTSGLSAAHSMRNKDWYPQRFQEVCSGLRADSSVIQIGSPGDPKLEGALDMRGKTTYRESAAILANSLVFIGLVGFLMHLARAVDCRSVIIYGGREKPTQTGYVANRNLYSPVCCAPCWLRNSCDFDRKCMDMITTEQVLAAATEQISHYGAGLEVQTAEL